MAVSAHNGLDEISTEGLTQISEFKDGKVIINAIIDPTPFGFSKNRPGRNLRGEDPAFNVSKIICILSSHISGRDVRLSYSTLLRPLLLAGCPHLSKRFGLG